MAMYMKIDKLDEIKGAATIKEISGKKGLIPIDSLSWGVSRSLHVIAGQTSHSDSGQIQFSDLSISRAADGASPYLQTFLFSPSADGRTVEFLTTRPERDGDGEVPAMIIRIEHARPNHYALQWSGSTTMETMGLVCTEVGITHYIEDETGTIKKGDTVKYDLQENKLVSKAQLP